MEEFLCSFTGGFQGSPQLSSRPWCPRIHRLLSKLGEHSTKLEVRNVSNWCVSSALVERCTQRTRTAGCNHGRLAGKLCDSKTLGELRDATNDTHTNSMYLATYKADPASYNPDNKKGGGYWLFDQVMPAAAPFNGTATYAAEIGNSKATTDVQLQRSLGLSTLTSASEQARQGRAGLNRATPVNTPTASNGDLLGYSPLSFQCSSLRPSGY